MESLGDKLRAARESKGCDYSQVGRETNIAVRYIEALENEDFSQFPGEPYVLGFLRNYGDYLGLDVNELVNLYRMIKIQEESIPVEQLLKPPKRLPKILLIVFLCIAAAAGIAFGVWYFLSINSEGAGDEPVTRSPVQYTLESDTLERRFYINDSVIVPFNDDSFVISLTNITDAVDINSPVGNFSLGLSEVKELDVNGDGIFELSIAVADLTRNDPAKGSLIRFDRVSSDAVLSVDSGLANPESPGTVSAGTSVQSSAVSSVLVSSPTAYPFTLQANFENFCMFRWESDQQNRMERYFRRDEVQNIQAQNRIRVWASNANAVALQLIAGGRTIDVNLGGPGEVVAADVRWIRGEDGRFTLNLVRLD